MSKALCVATKCTTKDQFVESFYRFCDEHTFFVATLNQRPIGLETPFSINLADRSPMLRGLCVVLEAWSTAENPFGRPGIKLGIKRLTTDSEDMFARLAQRRSSAAPAAATAPSAPVAATPAPVVSTAPTLPAIAPSVVKAVTPAPASASPPTLLGTGKSTKSFIPPIPGPGAVKPATPAPAEIATAERPNPLPEKPTPTPAGTSPGALLSAKLAAAGAAAKAVSPAPATPPTPSAPVPTAPVVQAVADDPPTMPVSMPEKPLMAVVPSVVAQIEQRTPGSDIVLPANPLMNLSDESLEGFVDCTVYEETGNFFTTEVDPSEPLADDLVDPPPPDFAPLRLTSAPMSAVQVSAVMNTATPTSERAAESPTTAPSVEPAILTTTAASPPAAPSIAVETAAPPDPQPAYGYGAPPADTQGPYAHPADATQPPYADMQPGYGYGAAPHAQNEYAQQPGSYAPPAGPVDRASAVMAPVARGGKKRTLAMAGGAAALSAIAVFAVVQSSSSAAPETTVAATKQPQPEANKPTELASAAAMPPSKPNAPTSAEPRPTGTDPAPTGKPAAPTTDTPDEGGEDESAPPPSTDGIPLVGTGPCRLDVTTTPAGTKVMVDDKEIGPSPISLAGPCDKHKVELIHPRYKQDVRFVALAEGAPKKLDVTLIRPTHQLVIKTNPPGATISIQGRRAGTSPTTVAVMGFSGIDVSISRQGYETVTKRVYSKTANDTLSISLKRYKW